MQRFAFLISVEKYQNFLPTDFCHADAALLSKTLVDYCDYPAQNIVKQQLSANTPTTPPEIISKLESMGQKTEPRDTVVFFFAGHGHLHTNGEPYLILPNTEYNRIENTALPLRSVADALRLEQRTNVRIIDACHSGYDVRSPTPNAPDFIRKITAEPSGWITLAACREDQRSYSDPALGNGIFTHFLCESIRESPDGLIYPEALKIDLCNRVEQFFHDTPERQQTPVLNASIYGNVVFAIKQSVIEQPPALKKEDASEPDGLANLEARLDEVRKFKRLGDDKYIQVIERLVETALKTVEEYTETLNPFQCEVIVGEPLDASDIPEDIAGPLISFVQNEGLRPIHTLNQIRIAQPPENLWFPENLFPTTGGLTSMFERPQPRYRVGIKQPPNWPNSYFEVELETDGYVPEGFFFVYVLPLQLSVALITGSKIFPLARPFRPGTPRTKIKSIYINPSQNNPEALVRDNIQQAIASFREEHGAILEENLKYLEWEISKLPNASS